MSIFCRLDPPKMEHAEWVDIMCHIYAFGDLISNQYDLTATKVAAKSGPLVFPSLLPLPAQRCKIDH